MIKNIVFIRHAQPKGKIFDSVKGIKFLGRKENPGIIPPLTQETVAIKREFSHFDLFFSSPKKRCRETLKLITNNKIIEDNNLLEIDYGDVDGMTLKDVEKKYPPLLKAWKGGKDIRFINGENHLDVVRRIRRFVYSLNNFDEKDILVCTHNVVLRCLIGSSLRIPVKDWHKIQIPYFEPLSFVLEDNKIIYKGEEEQKKRLLKNLINSNLYTYFIALIPEEKIYSKIYQTKKEIYQRWGNQKYLTNSPHATLYVFLAEDLDEVKNKLENIAIKEKKINAAIQNEYQEFSNDKLAGGGTSLGLKFDEKANKKIVSVQRKIVDSFNELRKGKIPLRYKDADLTNQLMENINKYGFPFIGDVFIPHITFCCFNLQKNAENFKLLHSSEEFAGSVALTKLALYKLYPDDKAELIKEFELQ